MYDFLFIMNKYTPYYSSSILISFWKISNLIWMEYLRPGQPEQDQIRVGKSILMQLIVSREDDSSDRINNSNQRICFNVNLFGSLEYRR